jgi:hypothetical protein
MPEINTCLFIFIINTCLFIFIINTCLFIFIINTCLCILVMPEINPCQPSHTQNRMSCMHHSFRMQHQVATPLLSVTSYQLPFHPLSAPAAAAAKGVNRNKTVLWPWMGEVNSWWELLECKTYAFSCVRVRLERKQTTSNTAKKQVHN